MDKNLEYWMEVYPNFMECTIQTFNDQDKSEKSQSRKLQMTIENLLKCVRLQELLPYWIYFSVNTMELWQRDAKSVKKIQTWICDIDEWTKEEQLKLIENAPLQPSLVAESVHGFHLYYLADRNLTEEQYAKWNYWLRNYYNGDIKVCKDIARVLRIPWFYHMKWDPVLVTYRYDLGTGKRYTMGQMDLAFPNQSDWKLVIVEQPKKIEKIFDCSDSYWVKVNRLDNRQMLRELSGTRWVDWEIIGFKRNWDWTEQITINWTPRSCWIDEYWMIGSYDNGWPSYIQWLQYYKKRKFTTSEWHEFSNRLNANHPELEEKKKKFDVKSLKKKETSWTQKGFVYPWEVFDDFECFMSGELVTIVAETNSGKTTFAMDLIKENADRWRKGLYINLEFDVKNVWKDKRLWFHGKTKKNLTDLSPLTALEKKDMDDYIADKLKDFDSYSEPNWIDLEDLEELIANKADEGYELFVVDTFSRIHWNLDASSARTSQNRCMEELQELVQKLNVAIVMLHHTNRQWTFEGSQKIKDLSNVFITIQKEESETWSEYRRYVLSKDKFVHNKAVDAVYNMWRYEKFYN